MIQLLLALQSGQRYTINDLAKMWKLSRRTVFRDLKDLQKAGVPCHYDSKSGGHTIKSEFFLLSPNLSTQEAFGLLLLAFKARNLINLPFKDSVLRAALKIENTLPDKIKKYCNDVLQNIYVNAEPQTEIELLDKIFAQLQKAILKRQIIRICYYRPDMQKSISTNLSPYCLMYNNHAWYVIGKSSRHKKIQKFKLNQIKELSILDKVFITDERFDIHEFLGRSWSVTPEGRLYNVKLRFMPEIAHSVVEVQWHNTQTVTFEDNGSAIIEFRVDGLNEIIWWVLSYGSKVQVLSPAVLRQKIVEIAQDTIKQNKQLSPT